MFTHLNTHSHYSLLRGTASPEALCAAVKAFGMDTVALTDTNGLYGLLLFLEAAKDYELRPIVGAEVRVSEGWHASGALSSDEACHATLSLFDTRPTGLPSMPPYDDKTLLRQEQESFGFLISRHPLELYADRLKSLGLISSRDLDLHVGKRIQVVGWLLMGISCPPTPGQRIKKRRSGKRLFSLSLTPDL